MSEPTRKFKIKALPTEQEFKAMPFGRQIEVIKGFQTFKEGSKSLHLSQKRQSYQKAIREAVRLYNVTEYYCQFYAEPDCYDDSFQFWYR